MNHQSTQRGASLPEYSLLVALVAILAMSATRNFGRATETSLTASSNKIVAAGSTGRRPRGIFVDGADSSIGSSTTSDGSRF